MFLLLDKYEDEFKLRRILVSFYERVSSDVKVKHFFMDLSIEELLKDVDHFSQFILNKPDRSYTVEPSQTADSSTQIGSSPFKEICHHLVEVLKEEAIQEEDMPRFVTDVLEIIEESKTQSSDRVSTIYEFDTVNYDHLIEILAKVRTKAELNDENILVVRVSGVQVPINIKINKKHQYLLIFGKVECKTHDQKALDELINKANSTYPFFLVSSKEDDDDIYLYAEHKFSITYGVPTRLMNRVTKQFASYFEAAVRCDRQKILSS
jgi:truncated hemoglobin YjbI